MKWIFRQIFYCVSVLSVLFTVGTVSVFAEGVEFSMPGSGTKSEPYLVSTFEHLSEIAEVSVSDSLDDIYFLQTQDITVNSEEIISVNSGYLSLGNIENSSVFPGIGSNSAYPFMGNYDGGGHSVKNIILSSNGNASGFFGYAKDAIIENLSLDNSILMINTYSGGIAANVSGATEISDCSFSGLLSDSDKTNFLGVQMGSITGYLGSGAIVTDCTASVQCAVTISPFVLNVGGISGTNAGTIQRCVNYSELTFNSDNYHVSFAGIAGYNTGSVVACRNEGEAYGEMLNRVTVMYVGGIVGENCGTVERCGNYASVSAVGNGNYPCYVGGIVGYNHTGKVTICSNSGGVYSDISYAGGIVGVNLAEGAVSSLDNCLNIGFVIGTAGTTGGLVGGNIAVSGVDNVASVESSLNIGDTVSPSFGEVYAQGSGTTNIKNIYVQDIYDENAQTLTENELTTSDGIEGLESEAWVYPKDGFMPDLTLVKNLEKAEVLAVGIDKNAGKLAYSVYSPAYEGQAVAVIAFYSSDRLMGVEFQNIDISSGYSVYTASSEKIAVADNVKIMTIKSLETMSPVADRAEF